MKTTLTFFRSAMAAVLLVLATSQCYATLDYTISFTASGVTSSVGSVEVQNLTKGTTVTVPSGNTLTLNDQATGVEEITTGNTGIRVLQNPNTGKSTLTFYAAQAGNVQMSAYALDGRSVYRQTARLEVGGNSLELSLPVGLYVIRVSGPGYVYSAKLQSLSSTVTQAGIKFLTHTNLEASAPQKSKATPTPTTTTMSYTTGDQLLYTATSGTYIASVPDVPTGSKTTNFNFATIPTSAIPSGTFNMGSPDSEVNRDNNETQHSVTLTAFRMSKYEITNAQYAAFLNAKSIGSNGIWATAPAYPTQTLIVANSTMGLTYNGSQWMPVTGYENAPVINVTWYGATEYATYIGGTLPTEAQWEYACRAGTTTPFNTGTCLTNLQANYWWSSPYGSCTNTLTTPLSKTQTVGTYAPNAYGLSDMHGNVWEWCSDWYGTYPTTAQTNPTGATTGSRRVVRGGSWYRDARRCRSAYRDNYGPDTNSYDIGFRVALVP
jgi:formylglycine-generating enzyme required for sulfatase activity